MNSVAPRRTLSEILETFTIFRRRMIDKGTTLSDMSERVHHMKIEITHRPGIEEAEV